MDSQQLLQTQWWNANVPPSEHTAEPPVFLQHTHDEAVIRNLATDDADFRPLSWDDVADIIKYNRLDQLLRLPSLLRRYIAASYENRCRFGSLENFVLQQRLQWENPPQPRGGPFEFPDDDVKILRNDWPYGFEAKIVHLVVWTKFLFAADESGNLTRHAHDAIEAWVQQTFRAKTTSKVMWWKNWISIRSLPSLEHFHVVLYDPDPDFIRNIIEGDQPPFRREGALP